MALRAGDLDRLVTLLRPTSVDDGFASAPGSAVTLGKRWASKADVSDRERMAAGQQGTAITTRFQMYWDSLTSTLVPADQISLDGAIYTIIATKELDRRGGVEVSASRSE